MSGIDTGNWKVKLTLLLASSLTIMSMITISASLPDMAITFADVPEGEALVKLSLSFPALFIALSGAIGGRLIDKFGRLKLLGFALFFYAFAGTAGYWLDDLYHILISRALLGICVGLSMTIVTTLIADYYEGRKRQQFAGLQIAVMSLAGIVFVSLGGFLADINWRVPFLLYAFSIIILPATLMYLREPDLPEIAAQNGQTSVKSPRIIWLVFFNVLIMWLLFFIIPVQIPFYLKEIGIEKNSLVGIAIGISTLFSALSSISFARIKDRLNFQQIFALGYFLMALAYAAIAYGNSYAMVLLGMVLAGLGMGLMIPNANVWVMQLAPLEIRGREIGKLTTFWFTGQFLSPVLLLPFLKYVTQSQLFYILGCILLLLSITFIFLHLGSKKTS